MSSLLKEILEGGVSLFKRRIRVFYNPETQRLMATSNYCVKDGQLLAYDEASDVTDDIAHILATEDLTLEIGN